MSTAYFEMIGGASGNMLLGSLIDAGADGAAIEHALRTIPVGSWRMSSTKVVKRGIAATHVQFAIPGEDDGAPGRSPHGQGRGHGRTLVEVLELVDRSGLSAGQKTRAASIYRRLGDAEAKVHGTDAAAVHFHEVGAVDAILDVAGTCVALDLLGIDACACSAFPIGTGFVEMQHGRFPNPPPATAELLLGMPSFDGGVESEMVTPTGAAILRTLVDRPGFRPPLTARAIGYGAGTREFDIPNVLRVTVGEQAVTGDAGGTATGATTGAEVCVLEANIDDMPAEHFELACERITAAGALDVWLAPIFMKKQRPATLIGAIAPPDREAAVAQAILAETTTLGVRVRRERRYVLERTIEELETPLGRLRVKRTRAGERVRRTLEYDDVVRMARAHGRPIGEIVEQMERFLSQQS